MIGVNRRRVMGGRPKDYFAFEAIEAGTFTPPKDMEYSLDGFSFVPITAGSVSPTVAAGKKIYWRGNLDGGTQGIGSFHSSNVRFNVMGNILSLCYGNAFEGKTTLQGAIGCSLLSGSKVVDASQLILPATTVNSCYVAMFVDCTSLVNAPKLPATTLIHRCYSSMFSGCTGLTTAPELPATKLATECYSSMFNGCTSLTTAPELPATTLKNNCYRSMFSGCTSLNYIKAMFTTTPSTTYTKNWVSGVAATGTFVKNSAATWEVTGVNGIPTGWTIETASE